ncbi:pyrroloquinoline quinone-dependent dehydrogenase [Ampullimonas aquatilis]|uniref:pyrroloquinoline quinone-dependent dehydrogenase n=1 Tax=Ampullimonas aquatilis TaxID=1341549 RepID=UPI003C708E19
MHHHSLKRLLLSLAILAGSCTALADSVTERIAHVANTEWPSFGRGYDNQRFSPLQQINAGNVEKIKPVWTYQSGVKATYQATPIVVNGVMYVSLPFNHVVALDAKTGKQLWRYEHQRRKDRKLCCGPSNRGVAVGYGKVFIGTVDARLIALDEKTGEKIWDIDVIEGVKTATENIQNLNKNEELSKASSIGSTGVGIGMAPVLYEGKVLIGITGVAFGLHLDPNQDKPLAVVGMAGNYGLTGFLAAYEVESGKRAWKFDTVPPRGWEGAYTATTADGVALPRDIKNERAMAAKYPDAWRYGGGAAWSTPSIDPKLGLLYFGTGNPAPSMEDTSRPGDNLYTSSLVALDIKTGQLRWHYQQVPHDLWGYDVASTAVLLDFERDGKKIPAVAQASKLGWVYIHDRATGELLLKSEAFVPQKNLFQRATPGGTRINPGVIGGVNWSPMSVDQRHAMAYLAASHWPVIYTAHETPASGDQPALHYTSMEPAMDEPRWGVLVGMNLATGHMAWQYKTKEPLIGGVLATAGNLVFMGEGDGTLNAINATDGKPLWQYQFAAGVNAPPISYEIDGVQYVAVVAGGNHLYGYPQGDQLTVFALK